MNVFIQCSNIKSDNPGKTYEVYKGLLFKWELIYAKYLQKSNPNINIYVISGKYGLLDLEDMIEPYDLNLAKCSKDYKLEWKNNLISQFKIKNILPTDKVISLTNSDYSKIYKDYFSNIEFPLAHLGIMHSIPWMMSQMGYKKGEVSLNQLYHNCIK